MKKQRNLSYVAVGLGCAALAAAATLLGMVWRLGGFSRWAMISKYATVLDVIDGYYVGEADEAQLEDAALSGLVDSLDRWSYYMTAEEYSQYQDYSNNQYKGIGVTVTVDEESGLIEVVGLTEGGPAQLGGVEVGDRILAVDGQDAARMSTGQLSAIIEAAYGKSVLLTLLDAEGAQRDVSVDCQLIEVKAVRWSLLEDGVGYIAISNFESGSAALAEQAVEELCQQGAESLLFDVRANPGGQITEMVELLDYLLPEGEIYVRVDKAGEEEVETSDASCVAMPMAVLIDANSYSAAEYFAAVLREYDWAQVVGQHSTGKSRSQVTLALSDGSAVHLSRYRYLTPSRLDLTEEGGLAPDVEVLLDEEQSALFLAGALEPEKDPQIQAAAALLAGTP